MQNCVRYLTHPQVQIDPSVPVPLWKLRAVGRKRVQALAKAGWLSGTAEIIASGEPKALEAAEILAAALGLAVTVKEATHENDRSATSYLPAAEFEDVASEFFATPTVSVRGWESALAAQKRIVQEMVMVLKGDPRGDVLVVGHGAVGTLLLCHYSRIPISRVHDQPAGGGNYFTVLRQHRRVLHSWRPMEMSPLGAG